MSRIALARNRHTVSYFNALSYFIQYFVMSNKAIFCTDRMSAIYAETIQSANFFFLNCISYKTITTETAFPTELQLQFGKSKDTVVEDDPHRG